MTQRWRGADKFFVSALLEDRLMNENDRKGGLTFLIGAIAGFVLAIATGFGWTTHARRNPEIVAAIACQAGYTITSPGEISQCPGLMDEYLD
jgi:hypothetical protein